MSSCDCHKIKERTDKEYKSLINRLSRIEGQIRGIRKMVENSAYCTDILMQVSAITAALNAFNRELLANHIRTCVSDGIKNGDKKAFEGLAEKFSPLIIKSRCYRLLRCRHRLMPHIRFSPLLHRVHS